MQLSRSGFCAFFRRWSGAASTLAARACQSAASLRHRRRPTWFWHARPLVPQRVWLLFGAVQSARFDSQRRSSSLRMRAFVTALERPACDRLDDAAATRRNDERLFGLRRAASSFARNEGVRSGDALHNSSQQPPLNLHRLQLTLAVVTPQGRLHFVLTNPLALS